MRRRAFLSSLGALGATALSGCVAHTPGSASGVQKDNGNRDTDGNSTTGGQRGASPDQVVPSALNPGQYAQAFDRVVDITQVGADPTGSEPIDDVLDSIAESGTLVVFPQGVYKMNRQHRYTGQSDMGFIGQNAVLRHGRVDAIDRFSVTEGEFDGHARLFRVGVDYDLHNGAFVFGGFIVDWDGPNRGMQLLDHNTAGDSEIRNIVFRGRHSLGCEGALRLNPQTPDSTCLLQNIDMRAGGQHYTDTINTRSERDGESWATSGLTAHPDKAGTLHVDRVYCGGWPDNGLYVKGGPGQTIVTHSIAANSKIANIRINGKGSLIDRCTVIINREISEHFDGQVGIRLDDGTPTLRRTRVEISSPIPTYAIFSRQVEEAWIHNVDVALGVDCVGIMCSELAGPTHITNVRFRTPTTGGGRLILGSPARPSDVTDDGVTIH